MGCLAVGAGAVVGGGGSMCNASNAHFTVNFRGWNAGCTGDGVSAWRPR